MTDPSIAREDFQCVLYRAADGVATITLNRPERRNALNRRAYDEVESAFRHAALDPEARCVVVTGADPAFCSGEDVKEMMTGEKAADPAPPPAEYRATPAAMAVIEFVEQVESACFSFTDPVTGDSIAKCILAGDTFEASLQNEMTGQARLIIQEIL